MRPISEKTLAEIREFAATAPRTPQERYEKAIGALRDADSPYARWCALGAAAKTSVDVGCDAEAEAYALELCQLAPSYEGDWNYGNAIQDFNLVLGRLCLKRGDGDRARAHLLEAGRSPGSPQMDTFGPNMSLARALIEAGHPDTALQYLELCRRFWRMDNGRLDQWSGEIEAGTIPDFGSRLM